jgi:IS5 family transposase
MKTFFDEEDRLDRLTELGDDLVKLNQLIDWEAFRPILDEIYVSNDNRLGGRQRYDRVMMFKILILQKWHGLSDHKMEFYINDRSTYRRFLGIDGDDVPDEKTIWNYRNQLTKSGKEKWLFDEFSRALNAKGLVTHNGSLVDATIVSRPEQKANCKKTGRYAKEETPTTPKEEHELRQIDKDARYTTKHGKQHFGYKDHVIVDAESKLITRYEVTSAEVHDGKKLPDLITEDDERAWLDSAYCGEKIANAVHEKNPNVELIICERGRRNHPLTEEQKKNNSKKAKIRSRVEHVFATMKGCMHGLYLRCVGKARAATDICLTNLAYNMKRFVLLLTNPQAKYTLPL